MRHWGVLCDSSTLLLVVCATKSLERRTHFQNALSKHANRTKVIVLEMRCSRSSSNAKVCCARLVYLLAPHTLPHTLHMYISCVRLYINARTRMRLEAMHCWPLSLPSSFWYCCCCCCSASVEFTYYMLARMVALHGEVSCALGVCIYKPYIMHVTYSCSPRADVASSLRSFDHDMRMLFIRLCYICCCCCWLFSAALPLLLQKSRACPHHVGKWVVGRWVGES